MDVVLVGLLDSRMQNSSPSGSESTTRDWLPWPDIRLLGT